MAEARFEERTYTRTERTDYGRSIPGILTDLLTQFTTLLRQESELARTELSEKVSQAVMGIALAVGAAILLLPALVILLMAGMFGLSEGADWPMWLSALVVGGAALIIGLILVAVGVSRLKPRALMPDKTIKQLQEDAAMAKRQMSSEPVVVQPLRGDQPGSAHGYDQAA
jgi:Putative Actinobacterial Holin-X, holin superfamily III